MPTNHDGLRSGVTARGFMERPKTKDSEGYTRADGFRLMHYFTDDPWLLGGKGFGHYWLPFRTLEELDRLLNDREYLLDTLTAAVENGKTIPALVAHRFSRRGSLHRRGTQETSR